MRQVEGMMKVTSEELQFSIWYLKQRGYVASDDKSNVTITVQGMEHLETNMPPVEGILALIKATGPSTIPTGSASETVASNPT